MRTELTRAPVRNRWRFLTWPARFLEGLLARLVSRMGSVAEVRRDANDPALVHVFWEAWVQERRTNTGSHTSCQHLLVDLAQLRVHRGLYQPRQKAELDSPFVAQALAEASARLGKPLALGGKTRCPGVTITHKHVTKLTEFGPQAGRVLSVQSREIAGTGDSGDVRQDAIRYFVDGKLAWSTHGGEAWLGPELCFGDGERFGLLYLGADTALVVLDVATGEVLLERFLQRPWE